MKTITAIIFLVITTSLQAQRLCSSEDYKNHLVQNNPAVAKAIRDAELQIQHTIQYSNQFAQKDTAANQVINIPVVVHVVYNTANQYISDAQVLSQLTALNNDFSNQNNDKVNRPLVFDNVAADTRINFCLARVAPDGRPTNGIVRKQTNVALFSADDAVKSNIRGGSDAWDCKRYLNIWVCYLGGRALGYATLPGGPANLDGVVIGYDVFGTVGNLRPQFNKGRTLTHEVGHWLGVKHIWGDTECGDDDVEDTPKQQIYNFGCPSFPHVSLCSDSGDGDMFMNFMDLSDDACMNMFTIGQKKRMRALFATGNIRNSFLSSFACDSNLVQGGQAGGDSVQAAPVVKQDIVKVYPNPSSAIINIEYKPVLEFITIPFCIYNTTGTKVKTGELRKENTTVNLTGLNNGFYIIHIGDGKIRHTVKIVKQ